MAVTYLLLFVFAQSKMLSYSKGVENGKKYPTTQKWLASLHIDRENVLVHVKRFFQPPSFIVNGKNSENRDFFWIESGMLSVPEKACQPHEKAATAMTTINALLPDAPHLYKTSVFVQRDAWSVVFMARGKTQVVPTSMLKEIGLAKRVTFYIAIINRLWEFINKKFYLENINFFNILLLNGEFENPMIMFLEKVFSVTDKHYARQQTIKNFIEQILDFERNISGWYAFSMNETDGVPYKPCEESYYKTFISQLEKLQARIPDGVNLGRSEQIKLEKEFDKLLGDIISMRDKLNAARSTLDHGRPIAFG